MNRYILLLVIIAFFNVCNLHAQQRVCGSTIDQWKKITQQPAYQQVYTKALQHYLERSSNASCDTIKIPVVVHIVYHAAGENVSDEQVQSQIDVLNEDYAAVNATILDVPGAWKYMIHDSKIRFYLAQRTPSGANCTGITRKYSDNTSFDAFSNNVKFDSLGGTNGWTPSSYFNIWVCNLTSGLGSILGISTFPDNVGFEPEKDGVIINYRAFGRTTGNLLKRYNLGRTVTHESGHWLHMFHVWGDDSGLCSNEPNGGTDRIDDTPDQADLVYGSPQFPQYDNCTPGDNGIMFMNYLEYTDDKVMMFFTPDQTDTMRAYFAMFRDTICSSMGATVASPLSSDLELVSILSPVTRTEQRCFHPVVQVRNNGMDTVTHFQIIYNMVDREKRSYKWTGLFLPGNAVNIELPLISGNEGLNVLEARIAEADSNAVNNYRSRSFKVDKENTSGCDDCVPLIYPNPVTGNSFCVKSCFTTSDDLTIRVINMLGQKVLELPQVKSNPGDVFPVNMEHLAKGVYIVQLINGDQARGVKMVYLPGDGAASSVSICN